jgi:hypothetical protein
MSFDINDVDLEVDVGSFIDSCNSREEQEVLAYFSLTTLVNKVTNDIQGRDLDDSLCSQLASALEEGGHLAMRNRHVVVTADQYAHMNTAREVLRSLAVVTNSPHWLTVEKSLLTIQTDCLTIAE